MKNASPSPERDSKKWISKAFADRGKRKFLLLAAFTILGGGLLTLAYGAYDYWQTLPEGLQPSYAERNSCQECHAKEYLLWLGSDHDRAMDHATESTVRGDFDDVTFLHVGFDDLPKLSESDLKLLLGRADLRDLALALGNAAEGVEATILETLSPPRRDDLRRHLSDLEELQYLRPCDITSGQQRIDVLARQLAKADLISLDFASPTRFFKKGGKFYVTTDNRQGEQETFEVKYVFGVRPLQQYLVEFPDGRIQCLPVTWDTEMQRWYHLYPKEQIYHDDPLHWTRSLQNWNYMCADCHTTNLAKNYDPEKQTYATTWSEIDVGCQTCHGPSGLHVKTAREKDGTPFWDRRYGVALPGLKDAESKAVIETCAPCHARRRLLKAGPKPPGHEFLDYYVAERIDDDLYYADGQILEEDYVYTSFLQSRMYHEEVRCTDCHDPHSTRVKFQDNRLCTQCHTIAEYDTPLHHHHPDDSKPGTLCVECHMPETTYMVADPRRDHSLRVPRPDLTVSLGIPNACNLCHDDIAAGETPRWAQEQCEQWYGPPEEKKHFAYAIAGGRDGDPEAVEDLVEVARRTNPRQIRPIVRASAVSLLGNYMDDAAMAECFRALENENANIRLAAIEALEHLPAERLQERIVPLLSDPVCAVRLEAARLLSRCPKSSFSQEQRRRFEKALAEYIESQKAVGDQAAAHLNLAVVYQNQREPELAALQSETQLALRSNPARREAIREHYHREQERILEPAFKEYRLALEIDPLFIPARINLAMLLHQVGKSEEAEKQFRKILQIDPRLGDAHYSMGLLFAEMGRLEEAVESLRRAGELIEENPRVHYNLGLALQKLGDFEEAEKELMIALREQPKSLEFLHALAILSSQQGEWEKAIARAKLLIQSDPNNPRWKQFLQSLRSQAAQPSTPKREVP